MTISVQTPRSGPFAGDGSTVAFAFNFLADTAAELVVTVVTDSSGAEAVQTLTTHYTVAGTGNNSGGTVTFVTAPAAGETVWLQRSTPKDQALDLQNRGAVVPQLVEDAIDENTKMIQDLQEQVDRAVVLGVGSNLSGIVFPTALAGAYIGWNAAGTALENKTIGPASGAFTLPGSPTQNALVRWGASNLALTAAGITADDNDDLGTVRDLAISRDIATPRDITMTGDIAGAVDGSFSGNLAANGMLVTPTGVPIATAGGTLAYTLSTGLSLSSLVDGMEFYVIVNASNTGAVTLNVDSIGAVGVFEITGTAAVAQLNTAGDWAINDVRHLKYDGTQFLDLTKTMENQSVAAADPALVLVAHRAMNNSNENEDFDLDDTLYAHHTFKLALNGQSGGATFRMALSDDGGSTFLTTAGDYDDIDTFDTGAADTHSFDNNASQILLAASWDNVHGDVNIYNADNSGDITAVDTTLTYFRNGNNLYKRHVGAITAAAATHDAVRFTSVGATFPGGFITHYAWRKS